jgi:hypothetical protein
LFWVSRRYTTHDATQSRDAWIPHTQTQKARCNTGDGEYAPINLGTGPVGAAGMQYITDEPGLAAHPRRVLLSYLLLSRS